MKTKLKVAVFIVVATVLCIVILKTTVNAENLFSNAISNAEEIVQKEEMAAAVRKVLDKIPAKYRDVVVLRIYAELPFSEIAESLKISESSAKVLFFRAKKMLLEELEHENLV